MASFKILQKGNYNIVELAKFENISKLNLLQKQNDFIKLYKQLIVNERMAYTTDED